LDDGGTQANAPPVLLLADMSNRHAPVLVPVEHREELDGLSKAALADMVWSFATERAGTDLIERVMTEVRAEAKLVTRTRRRLLATMPLAFLAVRAAIHRGNT
jgi:hypothetical protein